MPSTPTQRKRAKKVATGEPAVTATVDLSVLDQDWNGHKKRLLRYVSQHQQSKLAQLRFVQHFKPYCQRQLDEKTTELYQRLTTKSVNSKWINSNFTGAQFLVALSTILHYNGKQ
jgi:hypothetical protein